MTYDRPFIPNIHPRVEEKQDHLYPLRCSCTESGHHHGDKSCTDLAGKDELCLLCRDAIQDAEMDY